MPGGVAGVPPTGGPYADLHPLTGTRPAWGLEGVVERQSAVRVSVIRRAAFLLTPRCIHICTLTRRFALTLGPQAIALYFARRDELAAGLAPVGVRPCWAHHKKAP